MKEQKKNVFFYIATHISIGYSEKYKGLKQIGYKNPTIR